MQIPSRPTELTYTLRHHREREDAPEFVYRLPTSEEQAEIQSVSVDAALKDPELVKELAALDDPEEMGKLIEERIRDGRVKGPSFAALLCRFFDDFVTRIDGLIIEKEVFDPAKHGDDIPGSWKLEVGGHIRERLERHLTEVEEGNSFSPSSSADMEPTAISTSTPAAAADDA